MPCPPWGPAPMRSPALPERDPGSRLRLLIGAAAVLGAAAGASAAMWLRIDRSELARDLVAIGLLGAAVLAATLGLRFREQQRWHRLAERAPKPAVAGYVGGLATQADVAREFVGADAAAIVWTEQPRGARVAAVAGPVPTGWAAGATVVLPETARGCAEIGGATATAHALRLAPHRSGALVVWSGRPTRRLHRRLARAARAGSTAIEQARLDDAERRSRLGASHARRHLAMLVGASATLARAIDDWQPAFDALAAEIVPVHADYFALDIVGPAGELARAVAAHIDAEVASLTVAPDRTWPEWRADLGPVLEHGEPRMLRESKDASAHLTQLGLQSLALIPVRGHDGVAGVLSVGTVAPRRGLRPSDVQAYEELASRCAEALERVTLYRETQASARAAHMSERRLQALFEASPLAIIEVDPSDDLLSANRAAVALFRWPPPPAPRLLPPEVKGAFAALRSRLAAGQAVVADRAQVQWPDGTGSSLSVAAAVLPPGGLVC